MRTPLVEGDRIGNYEITRVLSETGNFGITYQAVHTLIDKRDALVKEYYPEGYAVRNPEDRCVQAGKEQEQQRVYEFGLKKFIDEANVLQGVSHPAVPNVFDLICHRRDKVDTGYAFLVMEFIHGRTLEEELAVGRMTESKVLRLLSELMDGLEAVHEKGVLHRDIKPANIMLRNRDDSPVLIDFGAAKVDVSSKNTTVQLLTERYAALEQLSPVETPQFRQGEWTDIYALGAVSYEALTGDQVPPADQRNIVETYRPLAERHTGRAGLARAIDAALRVLPRDRPQSVPAWRDILTEADISGWRQEPTHDQVGGHSGDARRRPEDSGAGRVARVRPWRRPSVILAAGALLAGFAALVISISQPDSGDGRQVASEPSNVAPVPIPLLEPQSVDPFSRPDDAPDDSAPDSPRPQPVDPRSRPDSPPDAPVPPPRPPVSEAPSQPFQPPDSAVERAEALLADARDGNAQAQTEVALLYTVGRGLDRSYAEALRWLQEAAGSGEPDAAMHLALMYAAGEGGVSNSPEQALHWFGEFLRLSGRPVRATPGRGRVDQLNTLAGNAQEEYARLTKGYLRELFPTDMDPPQRQFVYRRRDPDPVFRRAGQEFRDRARQTAANIRGQSVDWSPPVVVRDALERGALAQRERVSNIRGNPVAYLVAQMRDAMRNNYDEDAERAYRSALQAVDVSLQRLEAVIEDTGGNAGAIKIDAEPEDAEVFIDGERYGTVDDMNDNEGRLFLAGTHTIRVARDGYQPHEESINVRAGERYLIRGRLARAQTR